MTNVTAMKPIHAAMVPNGIVMIAPLVGASAGLKEVGEATEGLGLGANVRSVAIAFMPKAARDSSNSVEFVPSKIVLLETPSTELVAIW